MTVAKAKKSPRITPAHAGKRNIFPACLDKVRDHPRTRGEKLPFAVGQNVDIGITPAHAGKSIVHDVDFLSCRGSPPHTRGKGLCKKTSKLSIRITPAHAGKRRAARFPIEMLQDHPRTRGEKLILWDEASLNGGSPPHTRGKGKDGYDRAIRCGITPAHAGKSFAHDMGDFWQKDHPRTRGEKKLRIVNIRIKGGSPPHTRGKGWKSIFPRTKFRITPAHAGKSV